jgi:hypothetical protein
VHDPHNYLTPDVTLDIGEVRVEEIGPHRVRVSGAQGKHPPATLKATVCFDAGWLGEGEISYAGPNALARAQLAASVVRSRCKRIGISEQVRVEVLGTQTISTTIRSSAAPKWPSPPMPSIECAPPCAVTSDRWRSVFPTKC